MTLLPSNLIASNLMIICCDAVIVYLPLSVTLDLGTLGSPSFEKIFTAIPGRFNRSTKPTPPNSIGVTFPWLESQVE